jgi:molybdopterin converting factor small subunit
MVEDETITVTVKFFGGLRALVGPGAVDVSLRRGACLDELLAKLYALFPGLSEKLRPGVTQGYIHVLLDGRNVLFQSEGNPPLPHGSTVAFVPPIGGG